MEMPRRQGPAPRHLQTMQHARQKRWNTKTRSGQAHQPGNLPAMMTAYLSQSGFSLFPENHCLTTTSMKRLKTLGYQFKKEIELYRRVLQDPQTPPLTRWLLWAAVAYALSPIDLIPDFIPVLGHLDDLIVLPCLVWLAIRAMPPGLLNKHKSDAATTQYPDPSA